VGEERCLPSIKRSRRMAPRTPAVLTSDARASEHEGLTEQWATRANRARGSAPERYLALDEAAAGLHRGGGHRARHARPTMLAADCRCSQIRVTALRTKLVAAHTVPASRDQIGGKGTCLRATPSLGPHMWAPFLWTSCRCRARVGRAETMPSASQRSRRTSGSVRTTGAPRC